MRRMTMPNLEAVIAYFGRREVPPPAWPGEFVEALGVYLQAPATFALIADTLRRLSQLPGQEATLKDLKLSPFKPDHLAYLFELERLGVIEFSKIQHNTKASYRVALTASVAKRLPTSWPSAYDLNRNFSGRVSSGTTETL